MLKKVALGALLVALIGILAGGVMLRTESVAEARGQGQGRGSGQETGYAAEALGQERSANSQSTGRGGYGQTEGTVERQYPNYDGAPQEQVLYEGVVTQAPEAGVDLVLKTSDGEELVVGTGPGYMETQGFSLDVGETVQVSGYWEDDEFKAFEITRLADGQTITLRDEAGHPAWAGSGKRAAEQQAATDQGEQGQGRGRGQGRGQGQ